MKHNLSYLRWPLVALVAIFIAACASMGRPTGGPQDEEPPIFLRSNPMPGALNVKSDRITIFFNENVEVEDPLNQVVVSPAQKIAPKVTGIGHRVTVQLQDTLIPNTTYTIDFTNSIKDLNEGNVLEGFSFDFSTGNVLDSLCISGMVFAAENLEPAQSMLVGVHSNLSDTALTNVSFDRITRTNQYGQFTIRNLKPGKYRIFAVNDINRDNKWDRSEDLAFFPGIIEPTSKRVAHTDTVFKPNGDIDSIFTHDVTVFYPNDLLLTWFNLNYKSLYMSKNERKERNKIYFEMGAPSDTLPQLKFVGGPYDGEDFTIRTMLEASPTRDTLTYWIADSDVIQMDSIRIAATYQRTDSADRIVWKTDTLNFNMRAEKKKKDDKKKEKNDTASTPKIQLLRITPSVSNQVDIFSRLSIESDEPIRSFDQSGIHFEVMYPKDTVWTEITPPEFYHPDPYSPRKMTADYKWDYGNKYRLTIDTLSIVGIYDHHNGNINQEFSIRQQADYGNIIFSIQGLEPSDSAIVQLLSPQDVPIRAVSVAGGQATLRDVMPGKYYARMFIDRNKNGKWDTGSYADSLQAEDVFYFPKKIDLKKNWDINQTWNIYETPVDQQKPLDIKKNKPKTKRGQEQYQDEEDDQYYDEFGNPAVDPDDPFGKRKGNRNYNRNTRNNSTRNGLPGINGLGNGSLRPL